MRQLENVLTSGRLRRDWTGGSIFKNLLLLSWPIAVTQTLMMIGPTIDMMWVGNSLDGAVEFCAGAIVTPEARPIEPQLIKFEKKVEAGAEFFQTQAIHDLDNFSKFMQFARRLPVKVLAS